MGTKVNIADNTGAKEAKCIKVLGGSKKMIAKLGDKITLAIKRTTINSKIKIGTVAHGIIIRTKKSYRRNNGIIIAFNENAVVLINKENQLIGTRIFGLIPREIKDKGFIKTTSISKNII